MENTPGSTNPGAKLGDILITTNMNCIVKLDGNEVGLTQNTTITISEVPYGRHVLEGVTERHHARKEIFLGVEKLQTRLVLEEKGGTLTVTSDLDHCSIRLDQEMHPCPVTLHDLKRGVHRIVVSGDHFQFIDKVKIQNNTTTTYHITSELITQKGTEAAQAKYRSALELGERTLQEMKHKAETLEKILVNENRFELDEGIEMHRRLVESIRQIELKEHQEKEIRRNELAKNRKKVFLWGGIAAAIVITLLGSIYFYQINERNKQDELFYQQVVNQPDEIKYKAYIEKFGDRANHYKEAKKVLDHYAEDRREFQEAAKTDTIAAYTAYLTRFGQTATHFRDARQAILALKVKHAFPETARKLDLVRIDGGTFFMGATPGEEGDQSDNRPQMFAKINPFYIGKHEITFNQYDEFCKSTGHQRASDSGFGRGKHPVINVSWNDAMAYCTWLSHKTGLIVRLPSEAEWEFACRASRMTPYYWGTIMDHRYCNSGKKRRGSTNPVGQTIANGFGLYDMSGNVYEWCSDKYQDRFAPGAEGYHGSSYRFPQSYSENESGNPVFQAWGDRRALRGGSYRSSDFFCRSSQRAGALPETRRNDIGFRIAVTAPQ